MHQRVKSANGTGTDGVANDDPLQNLSINETGNSATPANTSRSVDNEEMPCNTVASQPQV